MNTLLIQLWRYARVRGNWLLPIVIFIAILVKPRNGDV